MILSFNNVSFGYDDHLLLDGVNFNLNNGEFIFLIGASGVGKTTLLRLIYLDLFPSLGNIEVAGFNSSTIKKKQIPLLRRKLGIVFQNFRLLSDRTIYDNLAFILHSIGVKNQDIKKRVLTALTEVGLSHKRNSFPNQLSGGEQQRVAIARAMINNPVLILADEPTGNLDPETSEQIMALLKKINLSGTSILVATHRYENVFKNSRVLKLKDKKLVETRDFI